jgi:fimbrial chaperone protein
MTQELIAGDKQRKAVFTLFNEGKKPIAVVSEMTKRLINEKGKETNPDASEDFMIFPDQLIIKPGEKRAVQITWLGKRKLEVEEAYRFIAEQLPIDVQLGKKKKNSNIKILLKYRAAFYLTPENAKAKVVLENKEVLVNKGKFELSLINEGNKHELLRNYRVILKGKGEIVTLPFKEFKSLYGENLLAKSKRRFSLKVPKKLSNASEIQIELKEI